MPDDEKIRENRLRRVAARQGIVFRRSRRRDTRALDFGVIYLIDADRNFLLATCDDLDQAEDWLTA